MIPHCDGYGDRQAKQKSSNRTRGGVLEGPSQELKDDEAGGPLHSDTRHRDGDGR